MTGQEFKDLYATGARDFQNADLRDANLSDANLTRANLTNADMRGANLCLANLWKCDLFGAKIDVGALSPKQIADGCFDDDILEKQGWVRKSDVAQEVPQPPRKLHALKMKVEFSDIRFIIARVYNDNLSHETMGEALDKLARAWKLNMQGDAISAAELMEDVNEILV